MKSKMKVLPGFEPELLRPQYNGPVPKWWD